jgi:hypothetical protein
VGERQALVSQVEAHLPDGRPDVVARWRELLAST